MCITYDFFDTLHLVRQSQLSPMLEVEDFYEEWFDFLWIDF